MRKKHLVMEGGEIPKGWSFQRLGDLATKIGSGSTPRGGEAVYKPTGIPLIRSMNVHFAGFKATGLVYLDAQSAEKLKHVTVQTGDVLLNITGASIGRVTNTPEALSGARVNQHVCIIRPSEELFAPFLAHFLASPEEQARVMNVQVGATRQALTKAMVENWRVPVPPLGEQRLIVAEIEKQFVRLEAGVIALKRVQGKLKRYRAAILKAACGGRLTPTDAELADAGDSKTKFETGEALLNRILVERRKNWRGRGRYKEPWGANAANLGTLPDGWSWASIEQLGDVQLGRQRSPKNASKDFPTKYIRAANITEQGIDVSDVLEMEFSPAERERFGLHEGDIVLSEASGSPSQVGKPAIWRNELPLCCFQNTVLRLRPIVVEAKYVLLVFQHFYGNGTFAKVASGVGINHLGAERFSAIPLPLPPLQEQARIVAEAERRLSIIDDLELVVSASLQRATRLRESILQQAFKGLSTLRSLSGEAGNSTDALNLRKSIGRKTVKAPQSEEPLITSLQRVSTVTMKASPRTRLEPRKVIIAKPKRSPRMRLLRLQLFDDFNSLRAFDYVFRFNDEANPSLSPICLVGLNGSGKSNLIEALSEVFCTTELALLPWQAIGQRHRASKLRFIVEYELKRSENVEPVRVRIENKDTRNPPIFTIYSGNTVKIIKNQSECYRLLPTRIISYSSGLNETISIPYHKTSTFYSEEVLSRARLEKHHTLKSGQIENSRTLFLDYESNAMTLVAIFLFKKKANLKIFNEIIRIQDLASFDIKFRPTYQGNKAVELTRELQNYIACFRKAADAVIRDEKGEGEIYRFYDSKSSYIKLKKYFVNSLTFFTAIYKLSLLNALALKGRDRKFFLREDAKEGQLERPPSVAKEDRIFAIEHVRLKLSQPNKTIDYAAISDGEHQFLQIFGAAMLFDEPGSLFLLDEPETHFNPQWRRRFVQHLDSMHNSINQEFMISTHSPFVVSGCRGDHVFKFERKIDNAICNKVSFETFGASYDFLLSRLFDLKTMISEQAVNEMRLVLKSTSINRLQNSIAEFGESFEKRFIFERIAKINARKKKGNS